MSRILLLFSNRSYRATAFLDAASREGFEVTVGTPTPQVFEAQIPESYLTLEFSNVAESVAKIEAFNQDYPFSAIVAAEDDGVGLAAAASAALGLRHASIESVDAATNKFQMRQRLNEAGMLSPKFELIRINASSDIVAHEIDYPVVLKPLFLSASRGVIRANSVSEFVNAYDRISHILRVEEVQQQGGELADHILVEEYIPGNEVALEGLLQDGSLTTLTIFDKPDPLEGPYFEETIYLRPSKEPAKIIKMIEAAAGQAAKAIGLQNGPIHIEMRLNAEVPWVIDIAPRTIGGYCSKALTFEKGRSLEQLILRQAVDGILASTTLKSAASGLMMMPIEGKGSLKSVEGLEKALMIPGIKEVIISLPIGGEVVPLPEGSAYLGFIFAEGETAVSVDRALRRAFDEITIGLD